MPKMAAKAISRRKKPQNVNSDTADESSDSDDGIENIEVRAPTHSKTEGLTLAYAEPSGLAAQ